MNICSYTYEEFLNLVRSFHGHVAPGVIIGGFMVDLALATLQAEEPAGAICETSSCLPDAIQLLTPCTIGNGRLKVVNIGRFALAVWAKNQGKAIRVFLDPAKLAAWPAINAWFLKLKPKKEQDSKAMKKEIKEAGSQICSFHHVKLNPAFVTGESHVLYGICPTCKELYPTVHGVRCLACQGKAPYIKSPTKD